MTVISSKKSSISKSSILYVVLFYTVSCRDYVSNGDKSNDFLLTITITNLSLIRDPPHLELKPVPVEVKLRNTAQGNSFTSVKLPPRMFVWEQIIDL